MQDTQSGLREQAKTRRVEYSQIIRNRLSHCLNIGLNVGGYFLIKTSVTNLPIQTLLVALDPL
jgi:hypothetical protein